MSLERLHDGPELLTVWEYEDVLRRTRVFSGEISTIWEKRWARLAPPVEALTAEGVGADNGRIWISDSEAYDLQIYQLLGIL